MIATLTRKAFQALPKTNRAVLLLLEEEGRIKIVDPEEIGTAPKGGGIRETRPTPTRTGRVAKRRRCSDV